MKHGGAYRGVWISARTVVGSATSMTKRTSTLGLGWTLSLSLLLAACGPGSMSSADGGADAGPPCTDCNDSINLHCTSAGGDEAADACNRRLSAAEMGATFFIGDRRQCFPNPNNPMCRPLCELSSMSFANAGTTEMPSFCTFDTMTPGCKINEATGYSVVVQTTNGRRAVAGVGNDGTCSNAGAGRRRWALVGLEDLRTTARCAAATPEGGYSAPDQFVGCDTDESACTAASGNTCQERGFRAGMTMYMRRFCTKTCATDAQCGSAGVCNNGDCFHRCGGPCSLNCPDGFTCSMGTCLPTPL